MTNGLERQEEHQGGELPTYLLSEGEDVFQYNLRMLISHFQTHEVASVSADPKLNKIGVHLEKADQPLSRGPDELALVVDLRVIEGFIYMRDILVPGIKISPTPEHSRLKTNTEAVSMAIEYVRLGQD